MRSRTESDRRVRKIMAAFDRALGSPHGPACGNHLPWSVVSCILSYGQCADEFQGWKYDGLRLLLLTYALHAPTDELAAMAYEAERQFAFIEMWDDRGCAEAGGCVIRPLIEAA